MTDEERLKAGKYQLKIYHANQYTLWRVAMVKSLKQILDNADEFYKDMKVELKQTDDDTGDKTVHCEIKNGLMFEALAQSMQAIEDLFSLMLNARDISFFIKNVVVYKATRVNAYIREFDVDNLEYVLNQMQLYYCPLDEPWEALEVFEAYKKSALLTQEYLTKLVSHHKRHSLHYNQYKHGQAVALRPLAKPPESIDENMEEAGLYAFDSYSFERRSKQSAGRPFGMFPHIHPDLGSVKELYNEENLLRSDLTVVRINDLLEITEIACKLTNVFWHNLIKIADTEDDNEFVERLYPTQTYGQVNGIGFPNNV